MKVGADSEVVKATVEKDAGSADEADKKYEPSKLDKRVQDFVNFINDKKLMEKSMTQVGYDVKKLPLG
jgi:hypothetical protein